ncbi:MAG: GAF domain-containing protein [bacterium]
MASQLDQAAGLPSPAAKPAVPATPDALNLVVAGRNGPQGQSTGAQEPLAESLRLARQAQQVTQDVLESRSRRQATIVRLGLEALASRDLPGTLALLVREAAATIEADFCSVLELEIDRKTFVLRAAVGPHEARIGSATLGALSQAQADYTLHQPAPIVSPDLRAETRFSVPEPELPDGARSGISVILHGKHQAWGVLGALSKMPRAFTEDDSHFLQAVANLMALAIERARVETTLRHRNRQQAAVAQLGRRALLGPHMDDFFAEALRDVAATLDVGLCDLLQRQNGNAMLLLRAGVGWQPGLVGTAHVPLGINSQAGFTLQADEPVIVRDLRTETRFDASEILREHEVVSGMSVVVPGRTRPFGVLGAYSRRPRAFTQDDSNFLQSVANLLAAAIERHEVEGQLRRHRDDLEGLVEERTLLLAASNRELASFSYTISHDLRAPLRAINGLSKILQRKHGDSLSPEAKDLLRLMADEAVRMGKLIESILSLSSLGSVPLTRAVVDVSAAATAILQQLQSRHPDRAVAWTVEPGLSVVGDEGLVDVILENLLGNAWKFTGRTADASIVVGREAGGFCVTDNGVGFDMGHSQELFQAFHRLHDADDFEGTGIGLATVGRIVSRHGGSVSAQSSPGKGATFRVLLPQVSVAAVVVPITAPSPPVRPISNR